MDICCQRREKMHLRYISYASPLVQIIIYLYKLVFYRSCIGIGAGLVADQILCLGISSHRGSFTVWDRDTAKPFHNFITWRDLRATNENLKLNTSMLFKVKTWAFFVVVEN